MADNSINFIQTERKQIKTLRELLESSKEYLTLSKLSSYERLIYSNRYEELCFILSSGIEIDQEFMRPLFISITKYLEEYGFDKETINSFLNNTNFAITDLKVAFNSNGLAQSSGRTIFLDHSVLSFDENGYFNGFKIEEKEFMEYVVTHELMHRISAFRDDKKSVFVNDSALSEGLTDYFARKITGYDGPKKSQTYQFSVDICQMFVSLLGEEALADDYINNIGAYPNLKNLFQEYSIDFTSFDKSMNDALARRYKKENLEEIMEDERNILIMLRDSLFIPYIENNPEKQEEIENKFNTLFSNYNISFDSKEKSL